MPPPASSHPCDEHSRRLEAAEDRLAEGSADFSELRERITEIHTAVCGSEKLGIKGLVSLHGRVESLERERTWRMGVAAALGFGAGAVPVILELLKK